MTFNRITHDPRIMGGKACIRGMRITISAVMKLLAAGYTHERIIQAYPELEEADFEEILGYASWRLQEEVHELASLP